MDSIGLGDLLAVMNQRDNDNWGGSWFWVIILFFFFAFFGRGFGGDSGALTRAELYDGLNYTQLQNGIRENQSTMREGFYDNATQSLNGFNTIERDLCQGFSTLNLANTNNFNNLGSQIQELGYQNKDCCCTLRSEIADSRAENYKNTCEITNAIHAEGEQTRALITQNTIQDLRDRLSNRDRDLMIADFQLSQQAQSANIIGTLRPFPQPAYITCSPYESSQINGCGCRNMANACL
nr:MAG TPA: hypothetical protein [Caudoviricetes sp.]